MKNILITGGLGFIGFNAVQLWKKQYPQNNYVVIDSYTYAAQFMIDKKLVWLKDNKIPCIKCDICNSIHVESIVNEYNIDTIVNFAAESHVDNSITGPDIFFQTNIIGTTKLLNIAKKYDLRFHQIGTDEVYGETSPSDWYVDNQQKENINTKLISAENKPIVPSSPYSSSKASADMISLSYYRTFGTRVTVSRCTNNFGPWQHTEKLIGTVISKALEDKNIPVYGEGNQKRHWIYVDEHNIAIMNIIERGEIGKIYNIAPPKENWITNITLIEFILEVLNKPKTLIKHITDRPGHDTSYFLYGTQFCQSNKNWKTDMIRTINWYKGI